MLSIIWIIFKIILIIIGTLLGIALLILLWLLFSPFVYNAFVQKDEDICINARARWLFGLVKIEYIDSADESNFEIRLPFGIGGKKAEQDSYEPPEEDGTQVYIQQLMEKSSTVHEEEDTAEKKRIYEEDIKNEKIEEINDKNIEKKQKISTIYSIRNFVFALFVKVRDFFKKGPKLDFIKSLKLKIEGFAAYVKNFNEKYDIKGIIAATIIFLKKIFKNMGFKVFEINGIIGFEDPSSTGKLIGLISAVKAFVPGTVCIEGDFEEERLEGRVELAGRTNLFKILLPIALYLFRKPVWYLVRDYMRGEYNE